MTTVESRIKGNQTLEKFVENVNLSIGFDISVLNLFQANSKFEYSRKWSFEVEFYDKNEIMSHSSKEYKSNLTNHNQ